MRLARLRSVARRSGAPWVVLGACTLALPAFVDVPFWDAVKFGLYEAAVVVGPGVALLGALCPHRRGWPWRLAVGWGLGYAVEVGVFVLTGRLDVPGLHAPACVAIGLVAGLGWAQRARRVPSDRSASRIDAGWSRWAAGAAAVVLALVSLIAIVNSPLPGDEPVTYDPDITFAISLAAEAKHHWPVTDPKVAGVDFPYHTFVYLHLAGASRATDVDLSVVYLRLYLGPLLLLASLQFAEMARRLGPGRMVGAVAIAMAFLVGEMDLLPGRQGLFLDFIFFDLFVSPTFNLGLVMLGSLLLLIYDGLERRAREWRGRLLALAALAAGCAGAKGSILPMLGLGLGVFLLLVRMRSGTWRRDGLVGLGVISLIWLAFFAFWYDGGRVGASIDPLRAFGQMPVVGGWAEAFDSLPGGEQVFLALISPLIVFGLCGALIAGVALALRLQPLDSRRLLIVCLLGVTVVPFFFLFHPGASQMFFVFYGLLGATPLAAHGLVEGFRRWRAARPGDLPWLGLFGVLFALALTLQEVVPVTGDPGGWESGRWYLLLAIVLCGLLVLWRRNAGGAGPTWLAAAVTAVLITAAFDRPADELTPIGRRIANGLAPQYQARAPLTPKLEAGLEWLRDHTTPDDVIATNSHYLDPARQNPQLIRVSAFAERRVFLESWIQTIRYSSLAIEDVGRQPTDKRLPYPERLDLNRRAFVLASPSALEELRSRYGVRALWVEKANGPYSPKLKRRASLVYENSECAVYALR